MWQENPDDVVKALHVMGIDAYRGATQLNIVEPDNGDSHLKHLHTIVTRYPHEAKFLMDHVVYLPVNKTVPFYVLDKICKGVEEAVKLSNGSRLPKVTWRSKCIQNYEDQLHVLNSCFVYISTL